MPTIRQLAFSTLSMLLSFSCLAQVYEQNNDYPIRPQTPSYDVPYNIEEVEIPNASAHIMLSGTLTIPMKKNHMYTCIVLVSDMGQHTRDEKMYGHKPFWVLADYLSRQGYAVLRYDDRGTEKSKGLYLSATMDDLASDVNAAVQYLKTRNDIGKVGVLGHGKGAFIAMKNAVHNSSDIGFLVFLAGTGIRGDSLYWRQQKQINSNIKTDSITIDMQSKLSQTITKTAQENPSWSHGLAKIKTTIYDSIKKFHPYLPDRFAVQIEQTITKPLTPELYSYIRFNPADYLPKICIPILALQGEKDVEFPPTESLNSIRTLTAQNDSITLKMLSNLNHLFQESNTGMIKEYGNISQTLSPIAMQAILDWLNSLR